MMIGVFIVYVVGHLLFNVFIIDQCFMGLDSEMCNFTVENTIYIYGLDLHESSPIWKVISQTARMVYEQWDSFKAKRFQLKLLGLKEQRGLRLLHQWEQIVRNMSFQIARDWNWKQVKRLQNALCSKSITRSMLFSRLNAHISREVAISDLA